MTSLPAQSVSINGKSKRGISNSAYAASIEAQKQNPYAPRASDFLSNISNFNIIESTLRGSYYSFLSYLTLPTQVYY